MRRTGVALGAIVAAVGLGTATAAAAPAAPAAPPLTTLIDAVGEVGPGGVATVSGTFTCPAGNVAFGHANVYQPAPVPGAAFSQGLVGSSARPLACTGQPQPWVVTTVPAGGDFVAGRATVYAFLTTVGPGGTGSVLERRRVTLG